MELRFPPATPPPPAAIEQLDPSIRTERHEHKTGENRALETATTNPAVPEDEELVTDNIDEGTPSSILAPAAEVDKSLRGRRGKRGALPLVRHELVDVEATTLGRREEILRPRKGPGSLP